MLDRQMSNFVIDSAAKLKNKLNMMRDLGDIEIATRLIEEIEGKNDIDANYAKLNCKLIPIEIGVLFPSHSRPRITKS